MLTLRDISRRGMGKALGVDGAHISRIFNPGHKGVWPSLHLARRMVGYLSEIKGEEVTIEGLYLFLESMGKEHPRGKGKQMEAGELCGAGQSDEEDGAAEGGGGGGAISIG